MTMKMCAVGSQTETMLNLGHPWVLADRHTRNWPEGKAGELVGLCDAKGRLLATALLDPGERVVARVLQQGALRLDGPWLQNRIAAAARLRELHGRLVDTDAYRVVNGEGDGLPGLTVDRYGDHLMLQYFTRAWKPHLKLVVEALCLVLRPVGIYGKFRPQQTRRLATEETRRFSRLLWGEAAPSRLQVMENGLHYLVELEAGLNTGLFCDQRGNRADLMERVAGHEVLNLFAYTGAFSVAAAAAGARQVTSVDASTLYLDWARDNFAVNRLNPKRHRFVLGDCFEVLAELGRQGRRFDTVVMDPPSFSTVGKNRFTTSGGTAELVTAALALLPPGGLLVTSSNHQKVDLADYLKELRRGALQAGCTLQVIRVAGQGEDFPYPVSFPEGRYLKYVLSVRN